MDTEKGYARFGLWKPKKIDFKTIQTAANGAGYTLHKLEVEVSGTVTKALCKTCKNEAMFLKADKTGQLIEIEGDLKVGQHLRIRGSVTLRGKDRLGFFTPAEHLILKAIALDGKE